MVPDQLQSLWLHRRTLNKQGTQQPPTSTQVPSETTPSTPDSIEVVSTEDVVISDSADVVNESTDDTSESTKTATECVLSKRLYKNVSERGYAKTSLEQEKRN